MLREKKRDFHILHIYKQIMDEQVQQVLVNAINIKMKLLQLAYVGLDITPESQRFMVKLFASIIKITH